MKAEFEAKIQKQVNAIEELEKLLQDSQSASQNRIDNLTSQIETLK